MKRLTIFALFACSVFAQGIVQQPIPQQIGSVGGTIINLYAVEFDWTGDAITGAVPVTPAINSSAFQGWRIIAAEFSPKSPAPTSGYSIQLTNGRGVDLLGGVASLLSATAAQSFTIPTTPPPLYGTFSLNLTGNSVAGARGVVVVYLAPAPVSYNIGGGGGGGGGGAVSSVFGRTGAVVAAANDYNFNQLAGTLATAQVGVPQGNGTKVQLSTGSPVSGNCTKFDANGNTVDSGAPCNVGTVTSVGLSLPAIFSVSGSPVTGSGTLTATLATQAANLLWAGPTTGAPAAPTFRAMVIADLPPVQGNGSKVQLSTGSPVSGNCTKFDANGNTVDAGAPCSTATGTLSVSGPYVFDGSTSYLMFPTLHAVTPPVTGNFAFRNASQGSATETNTTGGGIYLEDLNATLAVRFYGETKSPNYTIIMDIYAVLTGSQNWAGMAISDGTKYETFGPIFSTVSKLVVGTWTNNTTFSATPFSLSTGPSVTALTPAFITLKLSDNGTNRVWSYSMNGGQTFLQVLSEASNTFLTPTQVGIFVANSAGTGFMNSVWLLNCNGC